MKRISAKTVSFDQLPGHAIRRLQQISVGIFSQQLQAFGITSVQYAILQMVHNQPGTDQRTLASSIALDTSTTAGVVDRLEARGLVRRNVSETDRRLRLLTLTPEGEQLLAQAQPSIEKVQELILAPLNQEQREDFMNLLKLLVAGGNSLSRAPREHSRKPQPSD